MQAQTCWFTHLISYEQRSCHLLLERSLIAKAPPMRLWCALHGNVPRIDCGDPRANRNSRSYHTHIQLAHRRITVAGLFMLHTSLFRHFKFASAFQAKRRYIAALSI